MSFGAVEEAEAADLAAEMEADRETARVQGERRRGIEPSRMLWWLAPQDGPIRYDRIGAVRRRDCEARLMRAMASDSVFKNARGKGFHVVDMSADGGPDLEATPRFEPTQRDRTDYDTAMSWLAGLAEHEVIVCHHASRMTGMTFSAIGRGLGLGAVEAEAVYGRAIDAALVVANGGETEVAAARRLALDGVRSRNRLAKIG